MFSEIADRYYDLLMSSSMDNIFRVKFLELPLRDLKHHAELIGGRDLFHRCVVKYVEKRRTPLTKSAKTLPDVSPPDYLQPDIPLPSFFTLYVNYGATPARWMLCVFSLPNFSRK